MEKSPEELIDFVQDEATFLVFAKALLADRCAAFENEKVTNSSPYGSDAGGWENTSISDFLDASIAWAESSDFGRRLSASETDSEWKLFAKFLLAAKFYE